MNRCISLLYLFIAVSLPAFASEPFTLSKAIEKGLMNNLSIDFATQENRIGVKNMRMKYRKYFPTLSLGYSSTDTVTYFADDSHTKQLSATFTQLIYDRGVLHSSIHLEKERLALEAHQNDLNRTAFIFSVIDSYKNVLELEKELEISRQARSAVSQQVEIGHLEHNLGEITQFDFLELELALADMDIQITQISQKLDEARSAFSSVMNMKACDIPVLMGELNYLYDGFVNESSDYYVSQAMSNSLILKEIEYAEHKAKADYSLLKKKYVPDISLSCSAVVSGESYPLSEKSFSIFLNLDFDTPALPITLNTGIGKNSNEQRYRKISADADVMGNSESLYSSQSGKVSMERTQWNLEKYRRECQEEIAEQHKAILVLKENLVLARRRIELEQKKVEIEELKVQLGEEKRIDYVESQIALAQNRIKVFQTISELYSMETAFMNLCGIGSAAASGRNLIEGSGL